MIPFAGGAINSTFVQMEIDFRTSEQIAQEESLWEE